jgi:hypothetical protein
MGGTTYTEPKALPADGLITEDAPASTTPVVLNEITPLITTEKAE